MKQNYFIQIITLAIFAISLYGCGTSGESSDVDEGINEEEQSLSEESEKN